MPEALLAASFRQDLLNADIGGKNSVASRVRYAAEGARTLVASVSTVNIANAHQIG